MENWKPTGTICEESGLYECVSHRSVKKHFNKGDVFTNCITPSGTEHYANWELVYDKTDENDT